MDERRGVERMAGALGAELAVRERPQLVVDVGQHGVDGSGVSGLHICEEAGHVSVAHGIKRLV